MDIIVDDLSDPRVISFLDEHIEEMKSVSPPESKHALDLEGLKQADITFWSLWDKQDLLGCAAIKELSPNWAEIKSMRTASQHRGKGIASKLLEHLLNESKLRGYQTLSLETGAMNYFEPARNLYQKFGFNYCSPFENYREDPNSVFMTLKII